MNFTASSRYHCDVCDGLKSVLADILFERDRVCTCGVTLHDIPELTLHDVDCDTVPCPFCQLLDEPVHQEV
jgi:hypothetical protein